MSLTASMWTGVSGLLAHGERMNVLGNNIANVNTVGFKGSRMDFEDFLNQDTYSAAGVTQVGRGVSIGAIFGDYSQGAFQTTNESTDLAIQGRGFFSVKPKGTEDTYYTRAGNFRFDADGYLVDPHGYVLQGWAIERSQNSLTSSAVTATSTTSKIKGSGVPVDIKLDGFTAEPQHTQNITLNVNLDSNPGNDKSSSTTNPYFSLFETWNGQNPLTGTQPALAQSAFAYQSTIKVYDEAGTAHTLTVYFDQVDPDSVTNEPNGRKQWEYIVTMDPAEDKRVIAGTAMNTTRAAGLLMTGTLTFDTTGQLVDQTAFTPFGQYTDTTPPVERTYAQPRPACHHACRPRQLAAYADVLQRTSHDGGELLGPYRLERGRFSHGTELPHGTRPRLALDQRDHAVDIHPQRRRHRYGRLAAAGSDLFAAPAQCNDKLRRFVIDTVPEAGRLHVRLLAEHHCRP